MRIDELLTQFPRGAFVKLNTRSPKDVPVIVAIISEIILLTLRFDVDL